MNYKFCLGLCGDIMVPKQILFHFSCDRKGVNFSPVRVSRTNINKAVQL